MNLIAKLFKTHKNRRLYKQYINEHKRNVLKAYYEMLNCRGLEWIIRDPEIMDKLWIKILEHDDSKFDKEEFEPYRKNFYPISEEEKINNLSAFDKAWESHWKHNNHHWQARVNWKDEDFDINTEIACLENIADWLAMSYKFNDRPYKYYEAHKDEINLPKKQKEFIEKCIYQGIDQEWCTKQ